MNQVDQSKPKSARRSRLPQIAFYFCLLLVLSLVAIPVAVQISNYLYYFRNRYATEARKLPLTAEQVSGWMDQNASREATLPINRVSYLDVGTVGYYVLDDTAFRRSSNSSYITEKHDIKNTEEFKKWDRTVVDKIYALIGKPTPVWFPEMQQNVFGCITLVKLDFQKSIALRDNERAYKALAAYNWLIDASDWKVASAYLANGYLWRKTALYTLIYSSLDEGIWDESQLQSMRDNLLKPIDIRARLRDDFLDKYAIWLDKHSGFTIVPRGELNQAHHYLSVLRSIDHNPIGILRETRITGECEQSRRLAVMGVATKQYQLRHGAWPNRFEDLAEFGVPAEFWSREYGGEFHWTKLGNEGVQINLEFSSHGVNWVTNAIVK